MQFFETEDSITHPELRQQFFEVFELSVTISLQNETETIVDGKAAYHYDGDYEAIDGIRKHEMIVFDCEGGIMTVFKTVPENAENDYSECFAKIVSSIKIGIVE